MILSFGYGIMTGFVTWQEVGEGRFAAALWSDWTNGTVWEWCCVLRWG